MVAAKKKTPARNDAVPDRWSQHVTETSDAMDLAPDVFKGTDPEAIARSLKASAEHSDRRKADPFQSAMSMLTFYINRAGHNLEPAQRKHLEDAKQALRALFGRADGDELPVARKAAKKPAKTANAKTSATRTAAAQKTPARKAARKSAAR